MKKSLIIIAVLLINSGILSQDLVFENFKLTNGKFIWQKVYETKFLKGQIVDFFNKSGIIKEFKILEDSTITGNLESVTLDYKGYGKTTMTTVMYVSGNYLNSFISIELKEKKYRVTLKDLKFVKKHSDPLSEEGTMSDLIDYAIKKNNSGFRNSFKNDPSKIMNFTFDKIFTISEVKTDDW